MTAMGIFDLIALVVWTVLSVAAWWEWRRREAMDRRSYAAYMRRLRAEHQRLVISSQCRNALDWYSRR